MFIYNYDVKSFRNPQIFDVLRAYLILKMGVPLSLKSISDDLNKLLAHKKFKTSDVTVKRYLDEMVKGELIVISRSYIKPNYYKRGKTNKLDFGAMYYLRCSADELKEIFSSPCCMELRRSLGGRHASLVCIQRQTFAVNELYRIYGESLKSGVLLYQYYGENGKEIKLTISVDILIDDKRKKRLYLFGNTESMFKVQMAKREIVPQQICNALKGIKEFKINIVTLWDSEPQNEQHYMLRDALPANCNFVSWRDIGNP